MRERQTIADSKKAFHKAFPYVIPAIYRRVADELLVELHLLSHQKSFKDDTIFAIGLVSAFDSFTRGYKPEEHLASLFEAICRSNGYDPIQIRDEANHVMKEIKDIPSSEKESWLRNNGMGAPGKLEKDLALLSKGKNHYSRLISIGLLTVLKSNSQEEKNNVNTTINKVNDSI